MDPTAKDAPWNHFFLFFCLVVTWWHLPWAQQGLQTCRFEPRISNRFVLRHGSPDKIIKFCFSQRAKDLPGGDLTDAHTRAFTLMAIYQIEIKIRLCFRGNEEDYTINYKHLATLNLELIFCLYSLLPKGLYSPARLYVSCLINVFNVLHT